MKRNKSNNPHFVRWAEPAGGLTWKTEKGTTSMIQSTLKRAVWMGFLSVAALIASLGGYLGVAQAGTIGLLIADFDVTYAGDQGTNGAIFDRVGLAGRDFMSMNPAISDGVDNTVVELDNAPPPASGGNNTIFSGDDEMWVDMRVQGVGTSIEDIGFNTQILGANGNNFGLDWFTESGLHVQLNLDVLGVILTDNFFIFVGQATSVISQNLPFGLAFDTSDLVNKPIVVTYSASIPTVEFDDDFTSDANASGQLTISGTLGVPEPATAGLVLLGAAVLVAGRFRRLQR